MTKNIFNPCFK